MKQYKIIVTGLVQGIFFRQRTKEWVERKKICGWVKNERDGSVVIVVQTNPDILKELVEWCYTKAPGRVQNVRVSEEPLPKIYSSFTIET